MTGKRMQEATTPEQMLQMRWHSTVDAECRCEGTRRQVAVRSAGTATARGVHQRCQGVGRIADHRADVERVRVWRRGEGTLAAHAGPYTARSGRVEPVGGIDAEMEVGAGQRAGRVQVGNGVPCIEVLRGETEACGLKKGVLVELICIIGMSCNGDLGIPGVLEFLELIYF